MYFILIINIGIKPAFKWITIKLIFLQKNNTIVQKSNYFEIDVVVNRLNFMNIL